MSELIIRRQPTQSICSYSIILQFGLSRAISKLGGYDGPNT